MVGGAFSLLARLFPFRATDADRARYEDLARRYRALGFLEIVPVFAATALGTWLWYRLLLVVWAARLARLAPARFVLTPTPWFFLVCALFLGMLTAAPALHLLLRAVLRERFADYVLFTNLRVGFDTWKLLRGIVPPCAAALLALALLATDAYARVTDDALLVNPLLGLAEERHPLAEVAAIREVTHFRAPNGDVREKRHLVLRFADGTRWSTGTWLREPDAALDAALAAFVASRSGTAVEQVALDE